MVRQTGLITGLQVTSSSKALAATRARQYELQHLSLTTCQNKILPALLSAINNSTLLPNKKDQIPQHSAALRYSLQQ